MSRDMKKTPRSSTSNSSKSGGGGSLLTGLLIGLFGGVAVAVAVAVFLNRSGNPFAGKVSTTPADAISSAPVGQPPQTPEVLSPGGKNDVIIVTPTPTASAVKNENGERFDFYKMLPELADKKPAEAAKPSEPKKPEASPPVKVEVPKGAYLQIGSFQNEQDADNLKAKLALLGIEARIQTSDIPGKGIWHRVRLGPFNSSNELDNARSQLKANGVDSAVVK
ncbi:SPOR domain-containing protein [Iodobacter sp. HSC-16F04]|uniref:SPOR domain-containing protein n=1 Tax=Iodobacter violaceini TaxID=3044271 RepID=A0ABX0KR31_9NEIS|nr:SPOR domain-containing protein [Iodobacter violacea]NHQ87070.1 SPOR domain-containing protein [Iodobacter violacea]